MNTSECIICRTDKVQGIRICGQFICLDCERDIVHSQVCDKDYEHYIEAMKQIWISALSL